MVKQIVGWLLVSVFIYLWWWVGREWSYLDGSFYMFLAYSLLAMMVIVRAPRTASSNMFDGPIKGFMAMLPKLPWFALVFIVAGTLHLLITSGGFTLDFYIKGVLTSVLAAATTALVFGSADAT